MLKQRQIGKLLVKATGPYIFCAYKGSTRTTGVIKNSKGKVIECSVSHLLPIRSSVQFESMGEYVGPYVKGMDDDSLDSESDISM